MNKILAAASMVTLALLLVATVLGQVFLIPALAAQAAYVHPEVERLVAPGIAWGAAIVVCAQLVLVSVGILVFLSASGRIFRTSAFPVVNVMIGCCVAAAVLFALPFASILSGWSFGPAWVWLLGGVILSAGAALLIAVMKGLLRQASALERDMAEVV